MPIASKPRQLRIDLDPDQGFIVGISCEYTRHIEDDAGQKVADLPAHVEAVDPSHPLVTSSLADLNTANAAALLTYQAEVQRIGTERNDLQSQVAALQTALDASAQADPVDVQAQVRAIVQQELAASKPTAPWWRRFLGLA